MGCGFELAAGEVCRDNGHSTSEGDGVLDRELVLSTGKFVGIGEGNELSTLGGDGVLACGVNELITRVGDMEGGGELGLSTLEGGSVLACGINELITRVGDVEYGGELDRSIDDLDRGGEVDLCVDDIDMDLVLL
eukprot:6481545-Amphidinium_carterae.1